MHYNKKFWIKIGNKEKVASELNKIDSELLTYSDKDAINEKNLKASVKITRRIRYIPGQWASRKGEDNIDNVIRESAEFK